MPAGHGDGLHCHVRGPSEAPSILLIHGLGQQLVQWDVIGLSGCLLESGWRVAQYDQRDCGLSARFEAPEIHSIQEIESLRQRGELITLPYGLGDMVDDVFRAMDICGIDSSYVVGHSLGGTVALLAALRRPERFDGLVTISASVDNMGRLGPRPPGSISVLEEICTERHLPHLTLESIKWLQWVQSSPSFLIPHSVAADAAGRMLERGYDVAGNLRHFAAFSEADLPLEALAGLNVHTLVVHGSADPLLPVGHAEDIASRLPDAELKVYEGAGHNVAPAMVPELVADILDFFKRRGAPRPLAGVVSTR